MVKPIDNGEIYRSRARRDRQALQATSYLIGQIEAQEVSLAHKRSELANHLTGRVISFAGAYWLCTDHLAQVVCLYPTPGVVAKLPLHDQFEFVGMWEEWLQKLQTGDETLTLKTK